MTRRERYNMRARLWAAANRERVQARNAALSEAVKGNGFDEAILRHHQRAHTFGVFAVAGSGFKHNGHWRHL